MFGDVANGRWSSIEQQIIRISRNIDLIIIHDFIFDVTVTMVIGSNRAISKKIKKITEIRKNRRENGSRADLFGSNPHSNWDLFFTVFNICF
jgi:hypothetical protein